MKNALIILVVLIIVAGFGYFLINIKKFANGVMMDSQRVEEVTKSGVFNQPINLADDSVKQEAVGTMPSKSVEAKRWLEHTIKMYFGQAQPPPIAELTTKRYA
ncbi:MAG: hypothetical protein AAFO69_19855, partial [Bacteroidota bacterium]